MDHTARVQGAEKCVRGGPKRCRSCCTSHHPPLPPPTTVHHTTSHHTTAHQNDVEVAAPHTPTSPTSPTYPPHSHLIPPPLHPLPPHHTTPPPNGLKRCRSCRTHSPSCRVAPRARARRSCRHASVIPSDRIASTNQSQHSHSTVTAQSQHSHSTVRHASVISSDRKHQSESNSVQRGCSTGSGWAGE